MNKLKTFYSSYNNGKSYFEEDEKPNYLKFQPLNKYFKVNFDSLYYVSSWTSNELSNESIKPRTTSDISLSSILNYYDGPKIKVSSDMSCLIQDRATFNHGKIVNIYIVYKIIRIANINANRDSNLTIENALFGAATLTKNTDVDKYKYSGYGLAFDRRGSF